MLRYGLCAAVVLGSALVVASIQAGGSVKSGPQVGQDVPGPFHPLNLTGSKKGEKNCLYCSNGSNPVAVVFAREATPEVAKLLKQLDEATVKNGTAKMGSYAVFCSDKEGLAKQLESMAATQKLQKLVVAIDNPAGPEAYKIAKDADVTVLLYVKHEVKANYAFAKGQLNDAGITKVVSDVAKIVK